MHINKNKQLTAPFFNSSWKQEIRKTVTLPLKMKKLKNSNPSNKLCVACSGVPSLEVQGGKEP